MATRTTSAASRSSRSSGARAVGRGLARALGCTGGVLGLLMASGTALAQGNGAFANAPPNVLLLVDTSGSMERMPNGSLPVCTPGVAGQQPNRWGQLVQGLTGSVQPFYSCGRMMRDATPAVGSDQSHTSFMTGYWSSSLVGVTSAEARYDDGYHLPHHRPVSGEAAAATDEEAACSYFPDHRDGSLGAFGSSTYDPDRIATYPWSSGSYTFPPAQADKCVFNQAADGQLDNAGTFARFGMMTFDSDPSAGTGRFLGSSLPPTFPANMNVGGQWSFLYSNRNSAAELLGFSSTSSDPRFPLNGLIPGCSSAISMAVGARNEFAPPWEGPMIAFPTPNATLQQLQAHNDGVQKAILAVRPYGGTPTAGMMASAYDYMLRRSDGPRSDPFVTGGCRDQFVILLTDGAPNLDLRNLGSPASCGNGDENTTPPLPPQYCPFYLPSRTATRLRTDVTGSMKPIETFVVGFSVGGDSPPTAAANDGFPAAVATRTCAEWRQLAGSSTAMHTQCVAQGPALTPPGPAFGSTARACCELNDIALKGDPAGTRGAFFAENQSDLANVFGGILGRIARGASTRAIPAYSSPVTYTVAGPATVTQSSTVVASFNADPASTSTNQTSSANIWSGNLTRQRSVCQGGATVEQPATGAGDNFEATMQAEVTSGTPTKQRYFFTAVPTQVGGAVDGDETLRPYLASDPDGVTAYGAAETLLTRASVADSTTFRNALNGASTKDVEDMFNVKKDSCREVAVKGKKNKLPKMESVDCARVVWGFATAARPADLGAAEADFAVRCPYGGGPGQSLNPADCKPLGAVIRSSPAIVSAPSSLLRDEGYRKFVELFKDRRQTLYTATADGLLHAFDVNYPLNATNNGIELWAFVPPAAIGQLTTNFPGGQRTLLDGTPVVKDVVFKRTKTQVGSDVPWHTALVAGLGKDGYFALDVTADGQIPNDGAYQRVTTFTTSALDTVLRPAPPSKPVGPHFLWQLSSTQANNSGDKGKKKGHKNKKGDDLYAIFGDKTSTPAITTVVIGNVEVGVAILPGGIDTTIPSGPSCTRRTSPLYNFPLAKDQVMNPRSTVRGWAANCNGVVAGRSVTVVRLDTGEIIKHFARDLAGDNDVPKRIHDKGVVINSPFDAPITGTPVVLPAEVGALAQKVFVGDADGTLYRLSLSDPNPNNWRAELFLDTRGVAFSAADFVGDKPIVVPPVISLSETGNLVIGVANGDQEDFGTKPANDSNMLWSVTEIPTTVAGQPARPSLNWFMKFTSGERVTGPMAVFDKTLHFATYKVGLAGTACTVGSSYLYGRDYVAPQNAGNLALGGQYRSPAASPFTAVGPELIPGVSIRASQACAVDQPSNDYFGGTRIGAKLTTPTSYSLVANIAASNSAPGVPVKQISKPLALPRTRTVVDAWASIVE